MGKRHHFADGDFSVLHPGWHYALDCYAGFPGAAPIYGAVGAFQRRHARMTAPEQAGAA
jgi:hypothetical protein